MIYRRIIYSIAILLAVGTRMQAQPLSEKYNANRPVVVVCDWDKPPYEFLNDKGQPAGSNIDVMRAVMKELNLPVKFVMKEWSIALKTFEREGADLILANARRYRHAPYVVSENIVNYNRIRVAMRSDSVGMISLKQLEREGAVFKPGDYSAYYFLDGDSASINFMEFQTPKVALMGIISGDYKYYVWGEEPLKWKIKELNLEGITLNDVGIPISELHIVGRDRQLIEELDDQYSRLKQSGDIAILQDKWFHPERVSEKSSPVWLYITLGIILLAALFWLLTRLAQRHVANATRNSTELNDMMYQALHMGNFIVMEYDIRRDRFTNRYGQILPEDGLSLEEFTSRIHPDQQSEFSQKMRQLMNGRERKFELNKRWNTGTAEAPEWLNFQGHAISELDNDGRPAYIVNAIHDVTKEMEEDRAARDLVRKYDLLSNIPFIAMSFYDHGGWLIDLNDNMKVLCGISEDNPDSRRFWENVCMFDVPLFRNAYSPEDREDILFCQHMEYPELGLDRYIECQIQPLFNAEGEIANYFINAFDITDQQEHDRQMHLMARERRHVEQLSKLHLERLGYLCRNSERHIMRSDMRERVIKFYRTPVKPEYVHNFDNFLLMLEEDEREAFSRLLNDDKTREPQMFTIHLIKRSEGQPGSVFDITFNPVFDQQGNIIGHEGISSDVTTMYNAVKQLEVTTRQAAESVRLKSGFMASMTHELRTPLNAIVGFTGVLDALGETEGRAEYVKIIRNSSDMLQRLINDIIEASSFTDGKLSIVPDDIDFAEAFEDICLTLRQRVEQKEGLEFQTASPYEHFATRLDIGRIQQLLTNFVTNAVKFTEQGYVRVGYRYDDGYLCLYCEDSGKGIEPDKQEVVFQRFVKLDEFSQGTGMGLAICKSITQQMGGTIGVRSEGEGKGSTFYISIPCEQL